MYCFAIFQRDDVSNCVSGEISREMRKNYVRVTDFRIIIQRLMMSGSMMAAFEKKVDLWPL